VAAHTKSGRDSGSDSNSRSLKQQLAESERLLRLTGDLSRIGHWRVDLGAKTLTWSDEVYKIHGRSRETFTPDLESAIHHYHPDDRAKVSECVDKAISNKADYEFELRIVRADGALRQVVSRGRPGFDADGNIQSIIGIIQDVTEERAKENLLRRSNEHLRAHVDHTPLAVIEWDIDFRVVAWNVRAEEIFGYSEAEAMGKHATELIISEDLKDWANKVFLSITLEEGGTTNVNENRIKDGKTITCEWYNTALHDASGAVVGMASIANDITERANLEAQLRQSQKMEAIGTLAGGVAHDMNNVLAVVVGLCSVMQREINEGDPHKADLENVLSAAMRGKDMVNNLLGFARKGTYARKPFSLTEVVESLAKLLGKTIPKEISVRTDLESPLSNVVGDQSQITSALMNLCINASQAIDGRGDIIIACNEVEVAGEDIGVQPRLEVGRYVRVQVVDSGQGMDEETLKRSIEPFFTTKDVGEGTGLGLSMAYGAAETHGGGLRLDSVVGEGTTVSMFLPIATVPRDEIRESKDSIVSTGGKVLMIDDESMLLESVGRMLEGCGFTVVGAQGGHAGVKAFGERHDEIDVILLDLSMPDMRGADCFPRLQEIDSSVPVVICTGHGDEERSNAMIAAGAKGVLRKPFNMEELQRTLSELMSN